MRYALVFAAVTAVFVATSMPGLGPRAGLHKVRAAVGEMVDFNNDGFADLAIGVPMDIVSGVRAGAVNALYGTAGGLSATNSQLWSQNSNGITDTAEAGDRFGAALATGDFNGDGFTDLAIGVPGESVGTVANAGAVHVLFGSIDGLTAAGSQFFSEKPDNIPERPETGDIFGSALAAGDFNADGFDDLAIGIPGESKRTKAGAGAVIVLPGSQNGLVPLGSQLWHQGSENIPGNAEMNDHFGATLAAADFNGDGAADLAIGVPMEDLAAADAGGVNVLFGGSNGLSGLNSQFWHQDRGGITDSAEAGDQFGVALAAGDFNADGKADLVIGVRESLGAVTNAGAVHVLYGAAAGLVTTGAQFWTQNSSGLPDTAEAGDLFGTALAVGDFNGDGVADLVVGVPGEGIGAAATAGAVHVLYGSSPAGLSTVGTQFWTQDSGDILDIAESGDKFGSALASGDFDGNSYDELVIGVPYEDLSGLADAGAVHVINGGTFGLTSTNNQFWNQGTPNVPGDLVTLDAFGFALAAR